MDLRPLASCHLPPDGRFPGSGNGGDKQLLNTSQPRKPRLTKAESHYAAIKCEDQNLVLGSPVPEPSLPQGGTGRDAPEALPNLELLFPQFFFSSAHEGA